MDNFYVHLQSDSSYNFFPDNKIQDFRNHLASPLNLDTNEHEVALVQCSYVYNPAYLPKGTPLFTFGYVKNLVSVKEVDMEADYYWDVTGNYEEDFQFEFRKQQVVMKLSDFEEYLKKPQTQEFEGFKTYPPSNLSLVPEHERNETYCLVEEMDGMVYPKKTYSNQEEYEESKANLINIFPKNVSGKNYLRFIEHVDPISSFSYSTDGKNFIPQVIVGFISFQQNIGKLGSTTLGAVERYHGFQKQSEVRFTSPMHWGVASITRESLQSTYEQSLQNKYGYLLENHCVTLKKDVYNINQLVDEINQSHTGLSAKIENNLVTINIADKRVFEYIQFDDKLEGILGIVSKPLPMYTLENQVTYQSIYRPHFAHGQQKMYIYCDIVEPQFIGDQVAPILRIADYKGEIATTTTIEFKHNHYMHLRDGYIDNIHLYVRSESGDPLPIELGAFNATLHFRKRR